MKKFFYLFFILFITAALIFSYKSFSKKKLPADTESQKTLGEIDFSTKIKVPTEALKDTEIETVKMQKIDFPETISLIGEISINPDKVGKIGARLAGRITSVPFKEGDRVKKGDILLTLDSPEASRLRSKYISSLSRFMAAQKNANRLRELVTLRLAGEQEAVNAESELKIQESELEADRENLRVFEIPIPEISGKKGFGNYEIRSPMTGVILSRDAIVGGQVDSSTNLGTVGDISEVWFIGKLFEKDLSKVDIGEKARVRLNSYPDVKFDGRLTFISMQIDPSSRTVGARILLKNKKNLAKVGLFGTAEIFTTEPEVLAIHLDCITEINNKTGIFIEEKPGEYSFREIQIGRKSESFAEIVSGASEEEFVVQRGIFLLKSILLKSTFGGE